MDRARADDHNQLVIAFVQDAMNPVPRVGDGVGGGRFDRNFIHQRTWRHQLLNGPNSEVVSYGSLGLLGHIGLVNVGTAHISTIVKLGEISTGCRSVAFVSPDRESTGSFHELISRHDLSQQHEAEHVSAPDQGIPPDNVG